MTSPLKLAYMFLFAFSAIMIGVALVYLEGYIAGGFVGLWFALMMFSGGQFLLVSRQKIDPEEIQKNYRQALRKTRPRKKRRNVL